MSVEHGRTGGGTFALFLSIAADGTERLRAATARIDGARLHVSFGAGRDLAEVFRPEPAADIAGLVRDLAPASGTLWLPDLRLSFAGLMIRGARLSSRPRGDGTRQVTIAVAQFSGNVLALFRKDAVPADRLARRHEQVLSRAVGQVFLPVADLFRVVDGLRAAGPPPAPLAEALEVLRARVLVMQSDFAAALAELAEYPVPAPVDAPPVVTAATAA
jgi:hypothetical protein